MRIEKLKFKLDMKDDDDKEMHITTVPIHKIEHGKKLANQYKS